MAIEPDTKDWTWVLERRCGECGVDVSAFDRASLPALLRAAASKWDDVLQRRDATHRPSAGTWAPLEYAAHVRDVMHVALERTDLMLAQDDPEFADWDQDAAAIEGRYSALDPALVNEGVTGATTQYADRLSNLAPNEWERIGRRSDGARFSVDSLGRYMLHDHLHHLHDVGVGLEQVEARLEG